MQRSNPENARPWYREPWPWLLVVLPLAAVVAASAVTLWLALSNPDYTVINDAEYERIHGELRPGAGDG